MHVEMGPRKGVVLRCCWIAALLMMTSGSSEQDALGQNNGTLTRILPIIINLASSSHQSTTGR
jgi:hypothetical protein